MPRQDSSQGMTENSIFVSDFSLTTAEITYRLPDYKNLLQIFVWQDFDIYPTFPKLIRFLDFWKNNLDGPLYQVRVAHHSLITPQELKYYKGEFRLQ